MGCQTQPHWSNHLVGDFSMARPHWTTPGEMGTVLIECHAYYSWLCLACGVWMCWYHELVSSCKRELVQRAPLNDSVGRSQKSNRVLNWAQLWLWCHSSRVGSWEMTCCVTNQLLFIQQDHHRRWCWLVTKFNAVFMHHIFMPNLGLLLWYILQCAIVLTMSVRCQFHYALSMVTCNCVMSVLMLLSTSNHIFNSMNET